jgi:hypothetical protein
MGKIGHFLKMALVTTIGVVAIVWVAGMIPGVKTFIKSIFNPA